MLRTNVQFVTVICDTNIDFNQTKCIHYRNECYLHTIRFKLQIFERFTVENRITRQQNIDRNRVKHFYEKY